MKESLSAQEPRLYAIGAAFDSAAALYHAAEHTRDQGFRRWDVHSPFPIHGMDHVMGLGSSRLSLLALLGGVGGFVTGVVLIYYTAVINYPLIVQGKPYFSWEAGFPVIYELTILLTAFASFFGIFLMNLLPRLNHPLFNWDTFKQMADDGFFLVIEARDPLFSEARVQRFLEEIGGSQITLIHHDRHDHHEA